MFLLRNYELEVEKYQMTFEITNWKTEKTKPWSQIIVVRDLLKWYIIQKKHRHAYFCDYKCASCSQELLFMFMISINTCTVAFFHCVVSIKYAGFQWFMQVQQYIYLQDCRWPFDRYDHMQLYIFITEGK